MNNIDLAYIAGFFDGEGSIVITPIAHSTSNQKRTFNMRAQAVSTNEEIIRLLLAMFGGDIKNKPIKGNRKACWTWRVSSQAATNFLELVLPYLKIKKPQAELALEFQSHKTRGGRKTEEYIKYEAETKMRFSEMNRRGNAMITHGLIAAA